MSQKLAHRFRRADDFVEHRRAINFLPQNEVLVPELLFHPLSVVDVGCCHVPADDLAIFVFERVVLKELPAILPFFNNKRASSSNGASCKSPFRRSAWMRLRSSGWALFRHTRFQASSP